MIDKIWRLYDITAMMKQYPHMTIFVDGHTDQLAVNRRLEVRNNVFCTSNQCLSEKRAESVKQYFVQQCPIDNPDSYQSMQTTFYPCPIATTWTFTFSTISLTDNCVKTFSSLNGANMATATVS